MFVGYPKGTKGGLFYSPKDQTVKISTHATFLEEDYMRDYKPRSKVILEELSKTSQDQVSVLDKTPSIEPTNNQQNGELRRSGRVFRKPDFYVGGQVNHTEAMTTQEEDPSTYDEAMKSVDSLLRKEAMHTEMDSMKSNIVWELVDLPDGIKPMDVSGSTKRKEMRMEKSKHIKLDL